MNAPKKVAVVLNGFLHDLATGCWLAGMVAIELLHRRQAAQPALAAPLGEVARVFFWGTVAAAVVIFATGGARTFTYVDNAYGPEAERTRRRMLVSKHVLLLAVFGAAYWLAWHKVFP